MIYDEGNCWAGWAIAPAHVLSDTFSINSSVKFKYNSLQQIFSAALEFLMTSMFLNFLSTKLNLTFFRINGIIIFLNNIVVSGRGGCCLYNTIHGLGVKVYCYGHDRKEWSDRAAVAGKEEWKR